MKLTNNLKKYLEELTRIKRKKHPALIHKIHAEHKISKKTLFYIKEYGPHSNVSRTIIRESIKILLLASIISAFGGFAMERIKGLLITITPLIIMLPALNDMIGDFGAIVSSRFSTMLHEGKVTTNLKSQGELKKLFIQLIIIAIITGIFSAVVSFIIFGMHNYYDSSMMIIKILAIVLIDVILLVSILFFIAISAGLYIFKRKEDPNNFLIPITTSIADFGNMIILAGLTVLFF